MLSWCLMSITAMRTTQIVLISVVIITPVLYLWTLASINVEHKLPPAPVNVLIQDLREALEKHLADAKSTPKIEVSFKTCKERNITNYDDTSESHKHFKKYIPDDLTERIKNLVNLENMHFPGEYFDVLQQMRDQVKTRQEIIIVHALSSNHFRETQAMLKNLHTVVFPNLRNFTFIIYDLGLNKNEISQLKKHCRCTVLTFPFSKFPSFFRTLNCFSWKVFIIAAHFEQAEVIVWTDASIRIKNDLAIPLLIERTKLRGVQQKGDGAPPSPYRTLPEHYHSFGDSPCAHLSFHQCAGGWGMYHREPLIRHAFIKPWLTCASNKSCICPGDNRKVISCPGINPHTIGGCHRHDQSAVTTVLAKLFRENIGHFAVPVSWFMDVKGGPDTTDYFAELEKKAG